jgi:hypothetical protein
MPMTDCILFIPNCDFVNNQLLMSEPVPEDDDILC